MRSHGEILKEILKQKGIKVPELAKKINVPTSSIYAILNREGTGTRKKLLEKISVALNVPIEVFTQTVTTSDYCNKLGILKKIDKEPFYNCLKVRNIDMIYVSNILRIFGYPNYTPDYLTAIIENGVELDPILVSLIWQITAKETLLCEADLHLINMLNSLYPSDRNLMKEMITRLSNLTDTQKDYFKLLDKNLD